jgi:hypothetical protein
MPRRNASNPFYVEPNLNLLPGLNFLRDSLAYRTKQKKEEEKVQVQKDEQARKVEATKAALEAYKSGDPDRVAQVVLTYPEIGTTIGTLLENKKEYSEKQYADQLENTLTELETTGELTELPPEAVGQLDKAGIARSIYKQNPKLGKKLIESEFAQLDPKRYKAWKNIHRPEENDKSTTMSSIMRMYNEWKALPEGDKGREALANKLWPEDNSTDIAPSNIKKMMTEREDLKNQLRKDGLSEEQIDAHPDILGFNRKIRGEEKQYKPSSIMQMWEELEDQKDILKSKGLTDEEIDEHPLVRALNNKIMGIDIDMAQFEPGQIDFWGAHVLLTGKMPSLGRGKQATKLRAEIARSAAKQAYELFGLQYPGGSATALSAALEAVATSKDTNTIGMALGILEKQQATMGSFISNLDKQITEAETLLEELPLTDIRLLNVPIRQLYTRVKGDARFSKYHTYLAEISRELSKLAGGATSSIAAMSTEENKVWDRLIDKDLPVKEMLPLLKEAQHLAAIREKSVVDQLNKTRQRMRTRNIEAVKKSQGAPKTNTDQDYKRIDTQEEFDNLPSGAYYTATDEDGNVYTGRKP